MAQVTYIINLTRGTNTDLKNGGSLTGTLKYSSGTKPDSATQEYLTVLGNIGCKVIFSSLKTYVTNDITFQFGSYGYTSSSLPYQPSIGSCEVYGNVNASIFSVTDTGVSINITVNTDWSGNAVNIRAGSNIQLVIDYTPQSSVTPPPTPTPTLYASTATISPQSIDAGQSFTVTVSNSNLSEVAHRITWSQSDQLMYIDQEKGYSTTTCGVPAYWTNSIPNANSGVCTVVVDTYKDVVGGTKIGSNSYSLIINVPSSYQPSVGSLSCSVSNAGTGAPGTWTFGVQNLSTITLRAVSAQPSTGASIVSYNFYQGSQSISGSGDTRTITNIADSGTLSFSVTVTDSRGRTSAAKTASVSISPYSLPEITEAVAYRCLNDSSHTPSTSGPCIAYRATYTYTSKVNSTTTNSVTCSCSYRVRGGSSWTTLNSSITNKQMYYSSASFSASSNYEIKFTLRDSVKTIERIVNIGTSSCTLYFMRGGTGIGVGKECSQANCIDINDNWKIQYGGKDITPSTGSTTNPGLDAYPVGSIYLSRNTTSPASLFGGSWTKIATDKYLRTTNTTGGSTGGSDSVTLTTANMPEHFHTVSFGVGTGTSGQWGAASAAIVDQPNVFYTNSEGYGNSFTVNPAYVTVNAWYRVS